MITGRLQHKSWREVTQVCRKLSMFSIFSLVGILWCGFDFFKVPMLWQMGREPSFASLPYILQQIFSNDRVITENIILSILPFLGAFLPLVIRGKNRITLLISMLVVFHWFVLFSKIYSPQWILWDLGIWIFIIADLIKTKQFSLEMWAAMIVPNILTYILFPICWDFFVPYSRGFMLLSSIFIVLHALYLTLLTIWMKRFSIAKM